MKRWWWCHPWGWIAYEGARDRGEAVAYGMACAYFIGPGRLNGRRAYTGPMS